MALPCQDQALSTHNINLVPTFKMCPLINKELLQEFIRQAPTKALLVVESIKVEHLALLVSRLEVAQVFIKAAHQQHTKVELLHLVQALAQDQAPINLTSQAHIRVAVQECINQALTKELTSQAVVSAVPTNQEQHTGLQQEQQEQQAQQAQQEQQAPVELLKEVLVRANTLLPIVTKRSEID